MVWTNALRAKFGPKCLAAAGSPRDRGLKFTNVRRMLKPNVKVLKLCFKLTFQKIRCMQFRFSLKSCESNEMMNHCLTRNVTDWRRG